MFYNGLQKQTVIDLENQPNDWEEKMNRVIDRKQAILWTTWIVIAAIIVSLWPLRIINEKIVSKSYENAVMESEEILEHYDIKQMFIAQYDRLQNINIYFTEGVPGGSFEFTLYDAKLMPVMNQNIHVKDTMIFPGFCRVQVNIDTEVGREYYYQINGIDQGFRVAFEDNEDSGNIYNGTLYYANVEDTDHNVIARYDYKVPLRKGRTLVCDALFVLLGILITKLTKRYYTAKPENNRLLTVETVVKCILNPLIAGFGVVSLVAVFPLKLFSTDVPSNLFFILGILLLVVALLYAVNHDKHGVATSRGLYTLLRENWQHYAQSILFAGVLWACCNYMNGLYDIHHDVAYRQMLIFFALAAIVTFTKTELFNVANLAYVIVAAIAGFSYYTDAYAQLVAEDAEELKYVVLKLTVWVAILAGLVILNLIRCIFERKYTGISVVYGLVVAAFFTMIILYRNTRGWPIYLVIAFTVFYLRTSAWQDKNRLPENIVNGILLHFVVMMGYCLLHRPYMFFRYNRYGFLFHTATVGAVYVALVVCAAIVKFLNAYRKDQRLRAVYKELAVLGLSASYSIFSMSRTGFLSLSVMAVIVVPCVCFCMKKKIRSLLVAVAMMVCAVILSFPVAFTAQRLVPAVAADPILSEIEEYPEEIVHGRVMDSPYYITIQRFIQVFQMKVLGIPEEKCIEAPCIVREDGEPSLLNPYFKNEAEILIASAEGVTGVDAELEKEKQDSQAYANGRIEIFTEYIKNLDTKGHDDMWVMREDGETFVHAHNIYLQVAYDHGIYTGIMFLILGVATLIQALIYYFKKKNTTECAVWPLAILLLFAVAGLTEWIFHPCCPIGFGLLVSLAPLLFSKDRNTQKNG